MNFSLISHIIKSAVVALFVFTVVGFFGLYLAWVCFWKGTDAMYAVIGEIVLEAKQEDK